MSKPYELVDARQIIDRDQEKSARRAKAQSFLDRVFENFAQVMAVQFAGEAVVTGEVSEPALVLIPLIDDAQHAVRQRRPAVGAGKPAAGILDPQLGLGRGIGTDAILDLIGDAMAVVALVRLHDRIEAGLRVLGLQKLRVGAAARNRRDIAEQKNLGSITAPEQRVGADAPVVSDLAH